MSKKSDKRFAVVNLADNKVTAVYQKKRLSAARKLAVKLAMEQGEITEEVALADVKEHGRITTNNDTVRVSVHEME